MNKIQYQETRKEKKNCWLFFDENEWWKLAFPCWAMRSRTEQSRAFFFENDEKFVIFQHQWRLYHMIHFRFLQIEWKCEEKSKEKAKTQSHKRKHRRIKLQKKPHSEIFHTNIKGWFVKFLVIYFKCYAHTHAIWTRGTEAKVNGRINIWWVCSLQMGIETIVCPVGRSIEAITEGEEKKKWKMGRYYESKNNGRSIAFSLYLSLLFVLSHTWASTLNDFNI